MPLFLVLTSLLLVCVGSKELRSSIEDEAGTQPVFALADNGLDGYLVVSGDEVVAEEVAFKERLASLLRAGDHSLKHLQPHDIIAYASSPHGKLWSSLSQRHILSDGAAVEFVPDQVRLDFSAHFNHSRGISKSALEKALKRIADTGAGGLVSRAHNTTRRMTRSGLRSACDEAKHIAVCKTSCAGYMWTMCENCKCPAEGGTAQCVCVAHSGIFFTTVFSNSIYAVLMLIFGLFARGTILKYQPLEGKIGRKHWPNVGGEEFESDVWACCSNMTVMFFTCCCPAVRVSMTYYYAGFFSGYLKPLIIFCVVYGLPGAGGYIIMFVVLFLGRRFIRQIAPLNKELFTDICCICLCSYCVMCQEARHVNRCMEEVAREKMKKSGDLVGMAVALEDKA